MDTCNIITNGYVLGIKIGEGTCGKVWSAEKDGKQFAIKQCKMGKNGIPNIVEIDIAKRFKHPNIINFIDIFVIDEIDNKSIYYVMPIADKTLNMYIISMQQKKHLIFQILSAVSFLHENMICHGDLKPENILMFGDIPVITDFGLSCHLDSNCICSPTPVYAPPETLYKSPDYEEYFDEACVSDLIKLQSSIDDKRIIDIWSIGIVIVYILINEHIFMYGEKNIVSQMLQYIKDQDKYLDFFKIDETFISCVKRLLEPSPDLRVSNLKDILSLPIFTGLISPNGTTIQKDFYHNSMSERTLKIAVDWIYEVCCVQKIAVKCYLLSVDLFYRCFNLIYDGNHRHIQVIIAACMLIADKLDRGCDLSVEYLTWLSNHSFQENDLIDIEIKIILKLFGILNINPLYSYCSNDRSLVMASPLIRQRDIYINSNIEQYVSQIESSMIIDKNIKHNNPLMDIFNKYTSPTKD